MSHSNTISLALLVTVVSAPASGAQAQVATLTPGVPIERFIAKGEQHAFALPMEPGQAVKVTLDQAGADVIVELRASGESLVADEDAKHHYGRERLAWLAPATAPDGAASGGTVTVQLAVRAKSVITTPAQYTLTVAIHEPSDAVSRATRAFNDGVRLSRDEQNDSAQEANRRLEEAIAAWREVGDRELVADGLYRLGRMQGRLLQRPADGVTSLTAALALFDELGISDDSVKTLVQLGDTRRMLSQTGQARAAYEQAYARAGELDPIVRAVIEDDLALICHNTGEFERGIDFGRRAIETFRSAGAHKDEFVALERLSLSYVRMRRFDEALTALTDAIALGRQYGNQEDVASLTASLARFYQTTGDDEAAVATYRAALDQYPPQSSARFGVTVAMARTLNRLGEVREARESLERGLATVPPQLREYWAALADELGVSLVADGEPARALDLQRKALEIVQAGKSRFGELTILRDLIGTYRALGDLDAARATLARATAIAQTLPGRPYDAILLREESRIARQAGDLRQARALLDQAIDLMDSHRGQLQSQTLRAAAGGNSLWYYDDAIGVAMAMHAQAPQAGHDARAFELFERSRARSLTDLLSEARVDLVTSVDAKLLAEQRTLQQQLGQKDTALREAGNNPPAAATLQRDIDDLRRRLAVLDARIRAASPRDASIVQPTPLSLQDAQRLLDADTVLLAFSLGQQASWGWAITPTTIRSFALPPAARIEARARKVYADLTARQHRDTAAGASTLADIDRSLIVDAAALSDLVLGPIAAPLREEWKDRRLAIVTTGALEYIPFAALPAPDVQASSAPTAGTETTMTSAASETGGNVEPSMGTALSASATGSEAPSSTTATTIAGAGSARADTSLAAPRGLASSAAGSELRSARAQRAWLIDTHELVQLPSVSVLALLRSEADTRARSSSSSSRPVAVLADPVYGADDPRVRARSTMTTRRAPTAGTPRPGKAPVTMMASARMPESTSVRVAATSMSPASADPSTAAARPSAPGASPLRGLDPTGTRAGFARLIFSREEAQAIMTLAPRGAAFEALDFTANRDTIAGAAVADAGIIHIATHGILNSARPELSGLVLSLVDEQGRPQDGVLRLWDIFNLKLSADLVVLSGCQTGLGRQMNGEGLIGLTRGFMHAGVPRLVTSLWQVDDLATAELMRRFYRGLLVQHLSPAAALRAAQREMRASARWQSPFYWAAFTLIGDWQTPAGLDSLSTRR